MSKSCKWKSRELVNKLNLPIIYNVVRVMSYFPTNGTCIWIHGKCYFVFLLVCNQTLIIYMKKLHDSDWLRTVQFKCNTCTNYTSYFWIIIGWSNILCRNFEKSFLNRKKGYKKDLQHFLHENFFIGILSFNLEIICTCEYFNMLKLHLPKQLVQFQLSVKLTHVN